MNRPPWVRANWLPLTLGAIVAIAAVLRLVGLDQRVAHWDEARVAYFGLQYAETDIYEYRRITHGPFLHVVNGDLSFSLLGASDATARLVVAVVGAVLPASAWLFRDRLRPLELVGMAALLAVTPVVLYYSRFMRNDLLLAAVMLAGFGLLVRYVDHRQPRYLYGTTVLVALGFTMKENAIVYLVVWVGATALVLDHAAYRRGGASLLAGVHAVFQDWRHLVVSDADRRRRWARRYLLPTAVSAGLFVMIVTYFYLPRGPDEVRLLDVVFEPTLLGEVVRTGFIEPLETGILEWTPSGEEETIRDSYVQPLSNMVDTISYGGLAVALLAVLGFVIERYRPQTREVVMFASYWGVVSLVGYPLAASVPNPAWLTVHVLVPLAIPAAVGLAWLTTRLAAAVDRSDAITAGVLGVVLLLLGGQLAVAGLGGVYTDAASHDNPMVQYAQPDGDELAAAIDDIERAVEGNEGLDILYYGSDLYNDQSDDEHPVVENAVVTTRLPMTWYTLAMGATVDSEQTESAFLDTYEAETPPVVISTGPEAATLDPHLPEHTVYDERFFPSLGTGQTILVYIDEDAL